MWVSARQEQALQAFAQEHPGAQALPYTDRHDCDAADYDRDGRLRYQGGITGARALSIAEALQLGEKQNRDLQGARERLSGSKADIERAMAALLPTVTAQGKLTVNIPEVRLNLDQSGSVFGSAVQGACTPATLPASH